MHRSSTAALPAALWLVLTCLPAPPARADAPSAVVDARTRLARGDARGAVSVLEANLAGAAVEVRPALLDALRDAYAAAARQADSEGKAADAESFRDDLDILSRTPRAPATAPAPVPKPAEPPPGPKAPRADAEPVRAARAPAEPAEPLTPLPPADNPADAPPEMTEPEAQRAEAPEKDPAVQPASTIPLPQPRAVTREPTPAPAPSDDRPPQRLSSTPAPAPTPDGTSLAAAVEAFKAEKYDVAGGLFAALNKDGKLPPAFRSHWAYCRAGEVVRRINARPATPREWAAIDAEIQSIRELSPSNWFAEYLRNLASERNRDPRATRPAASTRSNKVIVRGSSPDEPPVAQPPGALAPAQGPPPTPVPAAPIPWSRQPVESANFVVVHVDKDRALAERAVRVAEATREAQVKRWGAASEAWSPKCEVFLFPTARDFARETLQPPDSPGFSTMGVNAGRVVLRRVNLRTDHPNMAQAILPHEVTHVVLADLFPDQQIPRWADEGMASLAEPRSDQSVRAAELDEPVRSGKLFRVGDLMTMTQYPRPEFWGLYYAQSISLTRFLVETGSPAQFLRFVQQSQQSGVEPALRQVYSIAGFTELQTRWLAYARETSSGSAALTASSEDPEKTPGTPRE